jgi:hypothetical protein
MKPDWKSLAIIVLVGLGTFIFIPATLGLLINSKSVFAWSLLLGAIAYLGFVNWYIYK